jgi:hypothetical protein
MDLDFPFSESFGRASTRNEMILSAEVVYNRLMNLSSEHDLLSFSVFRILLLQEDGNEDKEKRKALRNLFRPDRHDNIPLLSFVQSCDTIYKKIRYFRASVGNASVIDQVLESIIDVVFYSTLGFIILSLLKLNPWPLLVSMSTLLVTASFAVGPSCAKAIEVRYDQEHPMFSGQVQSHFLTCTRLFFAGNSFDRWKTVRCPAIQFSSSFDCKLTRVLSSLIRRPFDIGDRIIITDSPGAAVPTMGSSWFVEGKW